MVKLLGLLVCQGLTLVAAFGQSPLPVGRFEPPFSALENPQAAIANPQAALFPLQAPQPLLTRLKPADRARVLAALAGLIILGFALVLLAWWGARFTRQYLKRPWPGSERRKAGSVSEFDWASKPLYPDEDGDQGDEGEPRE